LLLHIYFIFAAFIRSSMTTNESRWVSVWYFSNLTDTVLCQIVKTRENLTLAVAAGVLGREEITATLRKLLV
jgi:hypothetical protein